MTGVRKRRSQQPETTWGLNTCAIIHCFPDVLQGAELKLEQLGCEPELWDANISDGGLTYYITTTAQGWRNIYLPNMRRNLVMSFRHYAKIKDEGLILICQALAKFFM